MIVYVMEGQSDILSDNLHAFSVVLYPSTIVYIVKFSLLLTRSTIVLPEPEKKSFNEHQFSTLIYMFSINIRIIMLDD